MKICWDNLENIRLTRNGNFIKENSILFEKVCAECDESFLGYLHNKYCSRSCAGKKRKGKNHHMYGKKHTEESKKKISEAIMGEKNPFYGKHHTEETRKDLSEKIKDIWNDDKYREKNIESRTGIKFSEETRKKMSESHKGENNNNWKGGVKGKDLPLYDTYSSQISYCEECRRSEEDINILEVKCTYCGKWFIPKRISVHNRIQTLKGNYSGEHRLYCSTGCKKACPIYGKTPDTLMKEDAVRAGRLNWLEMNREVQPELRQMVLLRDEYKCVKCEDDEILHCHHIYPVAVDPLLSADIDNCITLCKECHKEVHKLPGCSYGQLRICIE